MFNFKPRMWALVLAAPPKWTTSKAPGCTPKDPSGRGMGCSNNPSTLTFHKDAIPHVRQEFIQSPAGYTKLQKMFYSNMAKQAQFTKSRDRSAAYDAALNGRSAQPLNPSSEGPPAQPSTDYVPDAGGPCDGLSGTDKSGCLAQHANDGGGRATAVDVTGMLAAHAGSRSGGGGGAHNNGPTRVRATTPTEKRHTTVTPFIPNASDVPAGWSPTNMSTPGGSTATATATSTATARRRKSRRCVRERREPRVLRRPSSTSSLGRI